MTAWSKSSSREQATHKQFDEKMVKKTLVNSGCNLIINSTPEYQLSMDDETAMMESKLPDTEKYVEVEEGDCEVIEVDESTGEVVDTTKTEQF